MNGETPVDDVAQIPVPTLPFADDELDQLLLPSTSSSSTSGDDIDKLLLSSSDEDDVEGNQAAVARLDESLNHGDDDVASEDQVAPVTRMVHALMRQRDLDRDNDWEACITPNAHEALANENLLVRMRGAAVPQPPELPASDPLQLRPQPSTAVMLARAGVVYRAFKDHWAAQQARFQAFTHAFPETLSLVLQDRHRRLVNRDNWIPPGTHAPPPDTHPDDVLLPANLCTNTTTINAPNVSLRPHQVDGIRFLWDRLVEVPHLKDADHPSQQSLPVPGAGCILAHSMGLGKTCQVIGFLSYFERAVPRARVLLLVPKSTLVSWATELGIWIPRFADGRRHVPMDITVFDDAMRRDTRIAKLKLWTISSAAEGTQLQHTRLYMMSYEQAVYLTTASGIPASSLHIDLVVCDEGHRLKSDKRLDTQMIREFRTRRRLILTGTPLQNYLKEYFVMIDVVMPLFFPKKMFRDFFARPISASMSKHADPKTIELARQRTFTLIQEVEPFVQRRDGSVLAAELPQLTEFIVVVPLTPLQARLYDRLLAIMRSQGRKINVLQGFSYAAKLCAHPQVLFDSFRRLALGEFARTEHGLSEMMVVDSDDEVPLTHRGSQRTQNIQKQFALLCQPPHQYAPRSNDSIKLQLALELVRKCILNKEKILVFSMSTVLLDFFSKMLDSAAAQIQLPALKQYLRIDGSCSSVKRKEQIERFQTRPRGNVQGAAQNGNKKHKPKRSREADPEHSNDSDGDDDDNDDEELQVSDEDQQKHSIFLLSTKAGGVGLTLTAATRVLILDCSWNPADDRQAIGRAYRYGQTKPVFVYRLVCQGTLEHRIYDQKVAKEWLFQTVVESEVLRRDRLRGAKLQNFLVRTAEPASSAALRETDACCRLDPLLDTLREYMHHAVTHHSVLTQDEDKYGERERQYYDQLQKQGGVMALALPDVPPPSDPTEAAHRLRREELAVASASRSLAQVLHDIIERRRALFRNPNAPLAPFDGGLPLQRRLPQPRPPRVEGPGASKHDALSVDDSDDDVPRPALVTTDRKVQPATNRVGPTEVIDIDDDD